MGGKGSGRRDIKVDWEQVVKLCELMCTDEEIAHVMGVSTSFLANQKCYRQLREVGHARARSSLRRKQWEVAMKGNITMLIFLGKNYLHQDDHPPRMMEPKENAQGKGASDRDLIGRYDRLAALRRAKPDNNKIN